MLTDLFQIIVMGLLRLLEAVLLMSGLVLGLLALGETRRPRRRVALLGVWACVSVVLLLELVLMLIRVL